MTAEVTAPARVMVTTPEFIEVADLSSLSDAKLKKLLIQAGAEPVVPLTREEMLHQLNSMVLTEE